MSKQTRNLTILTIAMLVLNVVLLGFIFIGKKDPRRSRDISRRDSREHFERRMSNRLDLNAAQKEVYEKLHKAHKADFWEISKSIFEVKKKIGESLAVDQEVEAQALLMVLDSLHQIREQKYFDHTKAIFAIFNPAQRKEFLETLNKMGDDHRRKRRNRKD